MLQSQIVPDFDPDFSIIDGDFRVGDFLVRPLLKIIRPLPGRLEGEATERRLPDKAMAVLLLLVENPREVCERDFLLDEVWGFERESYDRVLDNAIREIRRAFGDDARNPKYVQTIAKTGYRLIAEVDSGDLFPNESPSAEPAPAQSSPSDSPHRESSEGESSEGESPGSESAVITTPNAETAPNTEPPEEQRADDTHPASLVRSGRFGRQMVGISLAALLVIAVLAWKGNAHRWADVLWVSIERVEGDTDAEGLTEGAIQGAFHRALVEEHPCGDRSLLRLGTPWPFSGRQVVVEVDPGLRESSMIVAHLSAHLSGLEDRSQITLPLDSRTRTTSLRAVVAETTRRIDGWICASADFPDAGRACHCLSSARSWSFTDQNEPYLEYLETAVRLDPDNLQALESLVELYLVLGMRDRAEPLITAGLERIEDPTSVRALSLLLRLAQLHRDHAEEGRLLEALIERQPDEPRWRLARAVHLRQHEGSCEKALEAFAELTESFPERADIAGERAETFYRCGNTKRALEELSDRIWSPKASALNVRLRQMYYLILVGRYEEARKSSKEAFALAPESSLIRFMLGLLDYHMGSYEASELWFQRSIEISESPYEKGIATTWRARIALETGQPDEALKLLGGVEHSKFAPDLLPLLVEGRTHLALGDVEEARRVLDEMRALHAPRGSRDQEDMIWRLDASIQAFHERWDDAVASILRAADFPSREPGHLLLETAQIALGGGHLELAGESLDRLLEQNPRHGHGHCLLGAVHEAAGLGEEAEAEYRRGLSLIAHPEQSIEGQRCLANLRRLEPDAEPSRTDHATGP